MSLWSFSLWGAAVYSCSKYSVTYTAHVGPVTASLQPRGWPSAATAVKCTSLINKSRGKEDDSDVHECSWSECVLASVSSMLGYRLWALQRSRLFARRHESRAHPLRGCRSTFTFSPLLSIPTVGYRPPGGMTISLRPMSFPFLVKNTCRASNS